MPDKGQEAEEFGFSYRRAGPADATRTVIALHGSGADETSMLPLAQAIDPRAMTLAVRGRIVQNGERRWFAKHSPIDFDQQSIYAEAGAFAVFLDGLVSNGTIDPARTILLGYSNGGNLVHSTLLLHRTPISRIVLLRCMPVLKHPPSVNLSGRQALIISGARDFTYGPFAPALVDLLRGRRVTTRFCEVAAGHEFGEHDIETARQWLGASDAAMS